MLWNWRFSKLAGFLTITCLILKWRMRLNYNFFQLVSRAATPISVSVLVFRFWKISTVSDVSSTKYKDLFGLSELNEISISWRRRTLSRPIVIFTKKKIYDFEVSVLKNIGISFVDIPTSFEKTTFSVFI